MRAVIAISQTLWGVRGAGPTALWEVVSTRWDNTTRLQRWRSGPKAWNNFENTEVLENGRTVASQPASGAGPAMSTRPGLYFRF